MSKKLPELKACPFCKGKPRRKSAAYSGAFLGVDANPMYEPLHWYTVKCTACGVEQPQRTYHTREESDNAWNNRA